MKHSVLVLIVMAGVAGMLFPGSAHGVETYRFERLWPALQQPWYFFSPSGVAVDATGSVYVADAQYRCVKKFTEDGQFLTQWPIQGSEGWKPEYSFDIAVDTAGPVYLTCATEDRVQKYSSDGRLLIQWGTAGSGPGEFGCPGGIAVDEAGQVYVVDLGNERVQKFTPSGVFLAQWATSMPTSIAVDTMGHVYVGSWSMVQKFTTDGEFLCEWSSTLSCASGIAVDREGMIYVVDDAGDHTAKFTPSGELIGEFEFKGHRIAASRSGKIYVTNPEFFEIPGECAGEPARVEEFTSDGQFLARWRSSGSDPGYFWFPFRIAADDCGHMYVVDMNNNRIQKFTADGRFLLEWPVTGCEPKYPTVILGIATYGGGAVYALVARIWGMMQQEHCVQKFTSDGQLIATWERTTPAYDIAVDTGGAVYVLAFERKVEKFGPDGSFLADWSLSGDGCPWYVQAVDIAVGSDGFGVCGLSRMRHSGTIYSRR